MSETTYDKSHTATTDTVSANLRRAFWKGFSIPAGLLVFFLIAPMWLNSRIHSEADESIKRHGASLESQRAFAQLDFGEVCQSSDPKYAGLRESLVQSGICGQFQRLYWARNLSILLIVVLLAVVGATLLLNQKAKRSRADLIAAYRVGWKIAVAGGLFKVILMVPLLAYGLFELSTLAADRYYPQLILAVVLGGLIALWQSAQILLRSPPLEFEEPMARAVTPDDAPALWTAVRAAAAKLNTAPPDHIVIGMQMNFYVTELAVRFDRGRVDGRTLFLSYPLLKEMSPDEVLAIVGHELGHFIGEDTRFTREFYPMRVKANGTLFALAQAGWAGWASVHVMSFFNWAFGGTEQAVSRERELLADRMAADLTSPATAARALLRFQVVAEAYRLAITEGNNVFIGNPLEQPLAVLIRAQLLPNQTFWRQLFTAKTPHPLDSHPSLDVRFAALRESFTEEQAKAIAGTETATAYQAWLEGKEALFADILAKASQAVSQQRQRHAILSADYQTDSGRRKLDELFPERRFPRPKRTAIGRACLLGVIVALGVFLAAQASGDAGRIAPIIVAIVGGFLCFKVYQINRDSELILSAESLRHTHWNRPLVFSDVEALTGVKNNFTVTATFRLKQKVPPFSRFSVVRIQRRVAQLSLAGYGVNQRELLELIHKYWTRQTDAPK